MGSASRRKEARELTEHGKEQREKDLLHHRFHAFLARRDPHDLHATAGPFSEGIFSDDVLRR